jgi:hypothetical protein
MHEKFTAAHKPHDKEDLLFGHEHVAHSHQEGVVSLQQYIFFQLRRSNLVVVENHILSQTLHCIHLLSIFFLDKENFTEAASANNFDDRKVLKRSTRVSTLGEGSSVIGIPRYLFFAFCACGRLLLRCDLFHTFAGHNRFVNVLVEQTACLRGNSLYFCCDIFL